MLDKSPSHFENQGIALDRIAFAMSNGPAAMSTEPELSADLDKFKKLDSALPSILAFAIPIAIISIYFANRFFLIDTAWPIKTPLGADRLIFIAYLSLFASMWAVYFLSKIDLKVFRVRTLRRLLLWTSEHWEPLLCDYLIEDGKESEGEGGKKEASDRLKEIEDAFKTKSQSILQTISMLIAVATLELGQIVVVHHWDVDDAGKVDVITRNWCSFTLAVGSLAAIFAMVSFLVAADSLDSIFHRYRLSTNRHELIRYFYVGAIDPRYFGLVGVLLAAIMVIAHVNPCLGAISIAIIICVGYSHWFPYVGPMWTTEQIYARRRRRLSKAILLLFPVLFRVFF
jgi:hypothetical protein